MKPRHLIPIFGGPAPGFYAFEAGRHPDDRTLNPLRVDAPHLRAWIEARDPRPIGHWRELGREEYGRAFTAARTAGHDIVDDLYFAFADTVERGGTEVDYQRLVIPILRAKGWLPNLSESQFATRVGLIYDTNLRLARASGRWARYQATKATFPYLHAVTARDDRVRHPPKSKSDHTAWDGIILPVDHAFWTRWFPPLGFRCRCSIIQLSRSQLLRMKGTVTSETALIAREARLGERIFASPAAPIEAQLASMVQATNDERMPGSAWVNPVQTLQRGMTAWDAILAQEAFEGLAALIERLFGRAA